MREFAHALALGTLAILAGCGSPADSGAVPVILNGQLTSKWCWAASGQMTMNFVHAASNIQQCDEANRLFGLSDCCGSPVPDACTHGGWPEFAKYGFNVDQTSDAALTWEQITQQISDAGKPFAFTWRWNDGGGHMMVATGYATIDGVRLVSVNNPLPPPEDGRALPDGGTKEVYTYDKYVGGSAFDHTHWDDYYNITYTGED